MRTDGLWHKPRTAWVALCLLGFTALAWAAPGRTVLVMGDSLSAAYGLSPEQGWVALLDARLARTHPDWRVVNASVSGETTGGGRVRFTRALDEHAPDVVVLELGANDALRGLPLDQARANLQDMIDAAKARGAKVLVVGVEIPPNYGPEYADAFRAMYAQLAETNETALLPFLLEPIATDLSQFQADTIHPTAEAQPRVMEHLWGTLAVMLE